MAKIIDRAVGFDQTHGWVPFWVAIVVVTLAYSNQEPALIRNSGYYKWLCAPKGAGFLYARPERQGLLEPLVVSWGYESEKPGPSQFVDHHEWWGTRDVAAFLSVPAAIQFQEENDWDKLRVACHDLAIDAESRICKLTGLPSLYADDSWFAQMISAQLPVETDIATLKNYLYDEHQIEVPSMEWNGHKLIRVSVQGYNTKNDIDALIKALRNWFRS